MARCRARQISVVAGGLGINGLSAGTTIGSRRVPIRVRVPNGSLQIAASGEAAGVSAAISGTVLPDNSLTVLSAPGAVLFNGERIHPPAPNVPPTPTPGPSAFPPLPTPPPTISPPPPPLRSLGSQRLQERVQDLISRVRGLAASHGKRAQLTSQLERARQDFLRGRPEAATKEIGDFVDSVIGLAEQDNLTPEDIANLVVAARELLAAIAMRDR